MKQINKFNRLQFIGLSITDAMNKQKMEKYYRHTSYKFGNTFVSGFLSGFISVFSGVPQDHRYGFYFRNPLRESFTLAGESMREAIDDYEQAA